MGKELGECVDQQVIFACGTEYHLLISFILSVTVYKNDRKIIFLHRNNRLSPYFESVAQLGVWDKVVVLDERNREVLGSSLSSAVLYFFSWGFSSLNSLFKEFIDKRLGEVILTEEGLLSYNPVVAYYKWLGDDLSHGAIADGFDLSAIKEIWLSHPGLYLGDEKFIVKEIPVRYFIDIARDDLSVRQLLESLFLLTDDYIIPGCGGVYFQQYASASNPLVLQINKIIDGVLVGLFQGSGIFIKEHPALQNNPELLPEDRLKAAPWELSLILGAINNKRYLGSNSIYFSISSSSMYNSALMQEGGCYVFLNKILSNYNDEIDTRVVDLLVDRIKVYRPDIIVFQPESFSDLANFIKSFGDDFGVVLDISVLPDANAEIREVAGLYKSVYNQGLRDCDKQLQNILTSSSWRLTEPLRLIMGRISNWKQALRHIFGFPKLVDTPSTAQLPRLDLLPSHPVVVVLPIYKDTSLTRACIISAMPGILEMPNAMLIMLNDCSPESDMLPMLHEVVSTYGKRVRLESNATNLGFVKTVNKGFSLAHDGDVVLLNSDVILPPHWLRRLSQEAYSDSCVGTVTPLSNNTTICTFPEFLQDNSLPFGMSLNDVDEVFQMGRLPNVEAPTGVGFCMYIQRDCLKSVGFLNEEYFPRGYGEENDFCQRAIQKGWTNLITPNLFVYHRGGVSFGLEKQNLIENATRAIERLHPRYHRDVQNFIQKDPLKIGRLVRLIQLVSTQPIQKVLHISHGFGGGTDQHIKELAAYCLDHNMVFSLILSPVPNTCIYKLAFGYSATADTVALQLPEQMNLLIDALKVLGVSLIHFHHVWGLHPQLFSLVDELGVPYKLTVHDYYLLGANPTLTNADGVYVEPAEDCVSNPLSPLPAGETLESWRARYYPFIQGATEVIFPSFATSDIFRRVYPVSNCVVAWHLEPMRDIHRVPRVPMFQSKRIVIGVLGALSKEKGADFLENVAVAAKKARIPFDFKLLGHAYRSLKQVRTTGPYRLEDIQNLILREDCDFLFYPAQWPETYSYTLSSGLQSGLPIIAPRLGAFPERLAGRPQVLMYEHGTSPNDLLDQMQSFVAALRAGEQPVGSAWCGDHASESYYSNLYARNIPAAINAGDAQVLKLENCYRLALDLLSTNNPLVGQLPHGFTKLLFHFYRVPGMRKLRDIMPPRLKRSLKNLVKRHYK